MKLRTFGSHPLYLDRDPSLPIIKSECRYQRLPYRTITCYLQVSSDGLFDQPDRFPRFTALTG